MVSQPVSIILTESAKIATTSMFATFPETHLYGGPSVPPRYQPLHRLVHGILPCHIHL